jgi:hypothetical protein
MKMMRHGSSFKWTIRESPRTLDLEQVQFYRGLFMLSYSEYRHHDLDQDQLDRKTAGVSCPISIDEHAKMKWLYAAADLAIIVFAIVGVGAHGWHQIVLRLSLKRLEKFLKDRVQGQAAQRLSWSCTVLFN